MLNFIDTLISYIAPHECLACGTDGSLLCSYCRQLLPDAPLRCYRCGTENTSSAVCLNCNYLGMQDFWVCTPYEGFAKALIRQLKFERAYSAAHTIAISLSDDFTHKLPPEALIVPIPTASSRVRQRGYDQSVLIAKEFAKASRLPYSLMLARSGQHRQTGHNRRDRLSRLDGVFRVKKHHATDTPIILIDDVLTTGATIESAVIALQAEGYTHISAMTFAVA